MRSWHFCRPSERTIGVVEDDERPTKAIQAAATAGEEPTHRDSRLHPGTDVGGYTIDGELGKGGMGVVYSATHPMIGKRAAIKVLKPEVSSNKIIVERFMQEARAVNQIGHPNIIDIFAFGKLPDGRAYHVMDLLVGESLRKRLKRGPLHPSEAASVIEETASALMAAHEKGFVHRDLKPDNIYLVELEGRWPEVKLLDFGLAKLLPEAGMAPFQTKAGVMLGTPEYMSPEQAAGKKIDSRTDIYALGVMMFEILTGQRPFKSLGDAFSTLQQHAESTPPSIRELAPQLPEEMVQLVDAMLAKDPANRPSLNAVRTVIKRLRTTTLPTRTQAGLEISLTGLKNQKAPPPEQALDVSPSRVGAQAVLPGDSGMMDDPSPSAASTVPRAPVHDIAIPRTRSPNPPSAPAAQPRRVSQPPIQAQALDPAIARRPSQPPMSSPGASHPGASHPGTSHPGLAGASHPGVSQPGARSSSPRPQASQPMPASSGSGLAVGPKPHAGTRLGVGPAIPAERRLPPPEAAVPRSSGLWILLGALLAIAAGIALAFVIVGT
jgi:serine/threonine protein kinase